ncbi:MAG TPA: trypsin-like peptidase domain-containing protein [Acidimicrobiales bacterium]|nr:trypsin-like peptidase domain-containing protein [Acidimicrobiales bacterium]
MQHPHQDELQRWAPPVYGPAGYAYGYSPAEQWMPAGAPPAPPPPVGRRIMSVIAFLLLVSACLFADETYRTSHVTGMTASVEAGLVDVNTENSIDGSGAAGTGMVISPAGEVLTNNHVIAGATSVSVRDIGNGRTYAANVVGNDIAADVAVLQIVDAGDLATAPLAPSDRLVQGESILGIGNAGGVGGAPSVASGEVSAFGQSIAATNDGTGVVEQLSGLIQTSAAIQPGDSGGPLVDPGGGIVGMDTATSVGAGSQASPASYAIPIGSALSIAAQIEAGHASDVVHIGPTAFLGVNITASDQGAQAAGAEIAGVVQGSPADQAGLSTGDVITGINGVTVATENDLTSTLQQLHPNDTVVVDWTDTGGVSHSATVELAVGPAQ